jgi:putative membrane protein
VYLYPEYKKGNKDIIKFFGTITFWIFILEVILSNFIYSGIEYYSTLSPKIFGVPFLIGVIFSIYIFSIISFVETYYIKKSKGFKVVITSILSLLFAFILEQVAIKFDYWEWSSSINFIRYLVWFICTYLVSSIYYRKEYVLDINLGRKIFLAIFGFIILSRVLSV